MSRIGEWVLRSIVHARKPKRVSHNSTDEYFQWQFTDSQKFLSLFPDFDIRGKSVLEIGCGTGGRTAYLATLEPSRLVGIDINHAEIDMARELISRHHPHLSSRVEYLKCSENDLLDIGLFDYVLLIDSLEHVISPAAMMKLAASYTKPDGRCMWSTMGWYHHKGSHIGMMPWVQLFFSDETILNVQRWLVSHPEYVPHRFDSDPPIKRWQWIYDLKDRPGEHLNKITIAEMKRLARHAPFEDARVHVIGFQRRELAFLRPISQIPVLQEVLHSAVVGDFRRPILPLAQQLPDRSSAVTVSAPRASHPVQG